jgi:CRISPR-associated protein Cas2
MPVYLVAYDVGDDRRRMKLSELLAGWGARVQLSLFEVDVEDRARYRELQAALQAVIDDDDDQVRVYPLGDRPERGLVVLGNRRLEERADFWIV